MKMPGVFTALRALVRIGRSLDGINTSLLRLANELAPQPDLTPIEPEPLTIQQPYETRWDVVEATRARLTQVKGVPPSDDELVHELDGLEWEGGNPVVKTPSR